MPSSRNENARVLQPLKPLAMMPTPASTSSTASTVTLCSPIGPSDDIEDNDNERDAFLPRDRQRPPRDRPSRHLHGSSGSRTKHSHRHAYDSHRHMQQSHKQQRTRLDNLESGSLIDTIDARGNSNHTSATHTHEWRVLRAFDTSDWSLQLVHLRHANYGLAWRSTIALPTAQQQAPPTCMVGPHWWLMATTFSLFFAAATMITVLTAPSAGVGEIATGVLLSGSCLLMYALVACVDPGIVPQIDDPPDDSYSYCDECTSYRPRGALHCMDCRACIDGYDHHCPWTGKCVGSGNVRYFYLWLFFLVLAFVYQVIEFTTYVLPPEEQPTPTFYDDDNGGDRVGGVNTRSLLSGVAAAIDRFW